MPETNRLEYKREFSTNVDLEKEVIAFLNYQEGGMIYIGIDKAGKILGVGDAGELLKSLWPVAVKSPILKRNTG